MEKKKVKAVITGGKDFFGVWLEGIENGAIGSEGTTIDDLKNNLQEAIALHIEDGDIPEVLQGDYEIEYTFDTSGFLKYCSQYISFAGLKTITGVAQKQLWDYANGYRHPKKETSEKIRNGINSFCKELSQVQLH
ncbi:MAG: type II toxin-antitoxin system HicB family antitoxin, partial [Prevotella sp.]|nr:type II toxin-antitoxin system HicB family antitoxin [Prevotella sp.]